jgi:hypothetical protein
LFTEDVKLCSVTLSVSLASIKRTIGLPSFALFVCFFVFRMLVLHVNACFADIAVVFFQHLFKTYEYALLIIFRKDRLLVTVSSWFLSALTLCESGPHSIQKVFISFVWGFFQSSSVTHAHSRCFCRFIC